MQEVTMQTTESPAVRAKGVEPCLKVDEGDKFLQEAVGVREAQVVTDNRLVGDR
jgi:hypothetical protein